LTLVACSSDSWIEFTMSDNVEIRELLRQLMQAWSAGDATAYASLFTPDADYVTFSGINLAGRDGIEAAHRALLAGPMRGSALAGFDTAKIRFLRSDVAVVVAEGRLSPAPGAAPDARGESTVTLVAVREAGDWRFAAFQNTGRGPAPVFA
jgi:uncharacterized protein (TIGR02246 family)